MLTYDDAWESESRLQSRNNHVLLRHCWMFTGKTVQRSNTCMLESIAHYIPVVRESWSQLYSGPLPQDGGVRKSHILQSAVILDNLTYHISPFSFGSSSIFPAMKLRQQLTLPLLVGISLLPLLSYGMPQPGSRTGSEPAVSKREDANNYAVYAKDSTNKDQTTAIGDLLKSVVSDSTQISVHDSDLGVAFWGVALTSDAAKKVEEDENVRIPVNLYMYALTYP